MKLVAYDFTFEREPLVRPFRFKGSAFHEKWVTVTRLETDRGQAATGIGSTAVLWSDPAVFADHSETGGNLLMCATTEQACRLLCRTPFSDPPAALDGILPELHDYARSTTRRADVRRTFALNALIAPDNTLWKLHAAAHGIKDFDALLARYCPGTFTARHDRLACVPLITYDTPIAEIRRLVETGVFLLKIKIGQPGGQAEMLARDRARLRDIHQAVRAAATPHTECGSVLYYLDANGRYADKSTLMQLVADCDRTGMLERIALLEEPFPEELTVAVTDVPLRIAADESLHSVEDVRQRIALGYGAITLKPAGKTLSQSLRMGAAALESGTPCFVADSACVPQLVSWNLNLAARLPVMPGLKCGFVESNGADFYRRWRYLLEDHPCHGQAWLEPQQGMFLLDDAFYRSAGGIFDPPGHYAALLQ